MSKGNGHAQQDNYSPEEKETRACRHVGIISGRHLFLTFRGLKIVVLGVGKLIQSQLPKEFSWKTKIPVAIGALVLPLEIPWALPGQYQISQGKTTAPPLAWKQSTENDEMKREAIWAQACGFSNFHFSFIFRTTFPCGLKVTNKWSQEILVGKASLFPVTYICLGPSASRMKRK